MAYSESLAERIRGVLKGNRNITEKRMFGGVCFLLHGNILVGVWKTSLIARVGPEESEAALKQEHVREMDITGKPMKGWILIEPEGVDHDDDLRKWVDHSIAFVKTLPAK
jgi:TfoX/Sxy family transcriptional regulator of competence genes